jgi:cell division protein FtsQ
VSDEGSAPSGTSARRPRWGRRAAAVAAVIAIASPWWALPMLRQLAFFRVRHVEMRGWHYATPADLSARLQLDTAFSIWSDLAPLEARIKRHPQIGDASISRRLPGTLVVTVVEIDPVALVAGNAGFTAYDAQGRRLPLDPSRTPVDLPILERRDPALLRFLAQVKAEDPALFARISEVRRVGRDELVLQLVTLTVRVMANVSVDRLAQISSVEENLASRHARPLELDLRFKDQVIARFP